VHIISQALQHSGPSQFLSLDAWMPEFLVNKISIFFFTAVKG